MNFDKLSNFTRGILSVAGCLFAIWQIENTKLFILAIVSLIVATISLFLDPMFKTWELKIDDPKRKSGLKYLVDGSRIICVISMAMLVIVPFIYKSFPRFVKEQFILNLKQVKNDENIYKVKIKYYDKCPNVQKDLFIYLRDSTLTLKNNGEEDSISAVEAFPVIVKIIGLPEDWLATFSIIFLALASICLLFTYPYKSLCS